KISELFLIFHLPFQKLSSAKKFKSVANWFLLPNKIVNTAIEDFDYSCVGANHSKKFFEVIKICMYKRWE
ncbi:hypothetical protein, partial [Legionella cincinnatiensis]|uniref:hypothetical protein n=1 Tax=Legionella cincinnatiensis TaxID=28085 RepID=UPI001A94C5A5